MFQQEAIQIAEYLHQQRLQQPHAALRRRQRILKHAWRTLITLAVVSTVLLVLVELADMIFQFNINDLPASAYPVQFILLYFLPIFVLFPTIALFYIRLLIKTLMLSVDSVVREKEARTWDFLTLSDVRPRSVVIGKVMATFRTIFREYLLLGVLRIGVVTWFALTTSRMMLYLFPLFEETGLRLQYTAEPQYLLIACAALPVLTLLSGLFTVVIGVFTGLFLKRPQIWVAWGIRTAILVAVFMVFNFSSNLYADQFRLVSRTPDGRGGFIESTHRFGDPLSFTVTLALSFTGVSFLDNGTQTIILLIGFMPSMIGQHAYLLWTLALVPVIYVVLIAFLLWLAITLARRQGM